MNKYEDICVISYVRFFEVIENGPKILFVDLRNLLAYLSRIIIKTATDEVRKIETSRRSPPVEQ